MDTCRPTWIWEGHPWQWICALFRINCVQKCVKENKKLMEMSTRNFSCSKGDLRVIYWFGFKQIPLCQTAFLLFSYPDKEGVEILALENPTVFAANLFVLSCFDGTDVFLFTLTMSPLIRVQLHGNGLYKLLQMPNKNKSRECQEEVGMTDNNTSQGKRMINCPLGIKV